MNRLAHEKSPYLLQHAGNPVDWYPWGDEAFARAAREQKPIFLSIGYSTCHWCHVMERESFEDETIAEVLNREYVAIKVDREERPDVDRVYMAFVQATTGSGGWPMSVWLTPELRPIYGGTYFPPSSQGGRPGFREVLEEIARAWRENRLGVTEAAGQLTAQLQAMSAMRRGERGVPDRGVLEDAAHEFARLFDAARGGFGSAPKFPRPAELLFLLREHARTGDALALTMVEKTLLAMASGGLRDHLGGGFHRYAVDADWRVPHFEKMLYDQAQLVLVFLEAYQATGNETYADVARDTLAYVVRDMRHPAGAFYSAEDADSVPSHQAGESRPTKAEGAFYLWSHDDVGRLIGPDAPLVCARFGIEPEGNAPFDPHHEFAGLNILYQASDIEELAREYRHDVREITARLDWARQHMLTARAGRPRPQLDDKVLTAWNGLMMAAFARAGRVLGDRAYLQMAEDAARFIREKMWDQAARNLSRRFRDGDAAIPAYADDYAFLIWGLLELFQAGGESEWLAWAIDLQHRQDELFWDGSSGGWFSTTGDDPSVLLRMKEDYDGAEPAASSIGVLNLIVLWRLTGDEQWGRDVEALLAAFGAQMTGRGRAVPMMLCALAAYHAAPQQLVVVGPADDPGTAALAAVSGRTYLPFAVFANLEPDADRTGLAALCPDLATMGMVGGVATAYWCCDYVCQAPVTDAKGLRGLLDA
jgi:uncharacterized protein YyaL (SSP411 family)